MKNKFKLEQLKVQSFVTAVNNEQSKTAKGGDFVPIETGSQLPACSGIHTCQSHFWTDCVLQTKIPFLCNDDLTKTIGPL